MNSTKWVRRAGRVARGFGILALIAVNVVLEVVLPKKRPAPPDPFERFELEELEKKR